MVILLYWLWFIFAEVFPYHKIIEITTPGGFINIIILASIELLTITKFFSNCNYLLQKGFDSKAFIYIANGSTPETTPKYLNPFAANTESVTGSIRQEIDNNGTYNKQKKPGDIRNEIDNDSTSREYPNK